MAEACCVPVVQNVLVTVVGNWIDRGLERNPIILVFKMKSNVDKLKEQVAELREDIDHVERETQAVERRGEHTVPKLKTWLNEAGKFIEAANTIEDDEEKAKKKCFFGMCLNPLSRYRLSKKAVEDSQKIARHVQKVPGSNLQTSYPPIPQRVVAAPVKGFQEFESRMDVLNEIMKALESPNINIIGVHGMPGVGKTTLLKEVKRKAEQDKLFDPVVMVSVTKKDPDYRKIQEDIAYDLGLELPVGIGHRSVADRLRAKFLTKRKVLVILDDIWDKLDLEALGIPFQDQQKMNVETGSSSTEDQQMKCKILLSSRELNVLKTEMCTQKEIVINQLEDQQAWQMFKKIVGDRAESNDFQSTGFEIARKCTGLPLAIAPLAEALKNKSLPEWRSALQRLNNPSPSNFNGIHAKVYTAIEVSYNHLGSKELKQTFLLSSLMDRNASLQDLLKYGVGLGLFSQSNTIGEARNEVITLIGDLKASSLLIDGSDTGRFDVHDVIRGVAQSIARWEGYGLFLTNDDLPKMCSDEKALSDFKCICLQCTNMNELPNELESPELTLFYLCNEYPPLEIPANFFKGMQRLRVLDLTRMQITLILILYARGLVKLGHLKINQCKNMREIIVTENVKEKEISFPELDFLHIENLQNLVGIYSGNCIMAFPSLKQLTIENCPKLKEFTVKSMSTDIGTDIKPLFNEQIKFTRLEFLSMSLNIQQIWHNRVPEMPSFVQKLKELTVDGCDNLRYLLTRSTVKSFEHLESLTIQNCKMIEGVIVAEGLAEEERRNNILFPNLQALVLEGLSKLTRFCPENCIEFPNLTGLQIGKCPVLKTFTSSPVIGDIAVSSKKAENTYAPPFFNEKVAFPQIEDLTIYWMESLNKIWADQLDGDSFCKLKTIFIFRCGMLVSILPFSMLKRLQRLETVLILMCDSLEEIVEAPSANQSQALVDTQPTLVETDTEFVFSKLTVLVLGRLPKAQGFLPSNAYEMPISEIIASF
ncbi:hypothetical protein SLEP1_g14861 [Rubroshorea leprosula]|uniref:AAA+ ATPase domain-containing protein n=1 Tax=Rubroshorea leprosula TaxID=152421 RepID=A0AAV5IWA7_9ROSI|nr:hypothetical protein SLEP1_g14861 [Rubroshorea leprosula]